MGGDEKGKEIKMEEEDGQEEEMERMWRRDGENMERKWRDGEDAGSGHGGVEKRCGRKMLESKMGRVEGGEIVREWEERELGRGEWEVRWRRGDEL